MAVILALLVVGCTAPRSQTVKRTSKPMSASSGSPIPASRSVTTSASGCHNPNVSLSFTRPTFFEGSWVLGIGVTNTGSSECSVIGYPRVLVYAGGRSVNAANGGTYFGDEVPTLIMLPPGKSVAFNVQFGFPKAGATGACASATNLDIQLPGDSSYTPLRIPAQTPATQLCPGELRVSSLYPPVY